VTPSFVGELTRGERLELSRRRAAITQSQAAHALRVSVDRLRRWERDLAGDGAPLALDAASELRPHERCWLARRRADCTMRSVSAALALSLTWVHRAETGALGADRIGALLAFWGLAS